MARPRVAYPEGSGGAGAPASFPHPVAGAEPIRVRPARRTDVRILVRQYLGRSEESRGFYHPFPFRSVIVRTILFGMVASGRVTHRRLSRVPGLSYLLLVAEDPASARIAGHAYYRVLRARGGPSRAVVGIEVEDGFQGRGIGSRLLEALAEEARHRRLDRLTATVHPDNGRSRRLFHRCGYAEVGRSVPPVGGRRRVPEIPYEKPLRTE